MVYHNDIDKEPMRLLSGNYGVSQSQLNASLQQEIKELAKLLSKRENDMN